MVGYRLTYEVSILGESINIRNFEVTHKIGSHVLSIVVTYLLVALNHTELYAPDTSSHI